MLCLLVCGLCVLWFCVCVSVCVSGRFVVCVWNLCVGKSVCVCMCVCMHVLCVSGVCSVCSVCV